MERTVLWINLEVTYVIIGGSPSPEHTVGRDLKAARRRKPRAAGSERPLM
jgi:hypothetical protein